MEFRGEVLSRKSLLLKPIFYTKARLIQMESFRVTRILLFSCIKS